MGLTGGKQGGLFEIGKPWGNFEIKSTSDLRRQKLLRNVTCYGREKEGTNRGTVNYD